MFDDEQRVFTRLSVFPGGCDLATAQAVCADDQLGAVEVEDIIQALVDKSLVNAAAGAADVRFTRAADPGPVRPREAGRARRSRTGPRRHGGVLRPALRPVRRRLHR